MNYLPDSIEFSSLSRDYDAVPVYRRMLADGLTPVMAFDRIDDGGTGCLFESVVGGERVGRYSFLAVDPHLEISAHGPAVTRTVGNRRQKSESSNPLEEIRSELKAVSVAPISGLPPLTGGAIGYAGYDVIRYVERLKDPPPDDRSLPDMSFAFYDRMIVFDNITKTLFVIALAWPGRHESLTAAYQDAVDRIDEITTRLAQTGKSFVCEDVVEGTESNLRCQTNFEQPEFEQAVRQAIEYIRAGDIFQVVLSQRMTVEFDSDPFEIYRSLRVLNPSPFMFYLRTPDTTLIGSSPEIMCRVVDGRVTVRPLAGTRPRGIDEAHDAELEQDLLSDPKELAEHVMLVDLGRNDVGRVAQYGSIVLPDVMVVERYSHVMHLSSTVEGQLRGDCDAFDALLSSLPAGTVSGAPKVRAMEIIDELEPNRRGPYAGAVGYIDYGGNMDTCIALRTIVVQGNQAYVQAGAGIVADSDPTAEYEETLNKARGLLRAIEMTLARST